MPHMRFAWICTLTHLQFLLWKIWNCVVISYRSDGIFMCCAWISVGYVPVWMGTRSPDNVGILAPCWPKKMRTSRTARILDTWKSQMCASSPDMASVSETKSRIDWNLTHFHTQEIKNHRIVVTIILLLLLLVRHNVRILYHLTLRTHLTARLWPQQATEIQLAILFIKNLRQWSKRRNEKSVICNMIIEFRMREKERSIHIIVVLNYSYRWIACVCVLYPV